MVIYILYTIYYQELDLLTFLRIIKQLLLPYLLLTNHRHYSLRQNLDVLVYMWLNFLLLHDLLHLYDDRPKVCIYTHASASAAKPSSTT